MTIGNIAGLIAACAFAVLVIFLAVPLHKLGKLFDQLSASTKELSTSTDETVQEVSATLRDAHEQLEKIDTVTTSAAQVAQDISAVSTLVSATIGRPLVKMAAFSQATRDFINRRTAQTQKRPTSVRSMEPVATTTAGNDEEVGE